MRAFLLSAVVVLLLGSQAKALTCELDCMRMANHSSASMKQMSAHCRGMNTMQEDARTATAGPVHLCMHPEQQPMVLTTVAPATHLHPSQTVALLSPEEPQPHPSLLPSLSRLRSFAATPSVPLRV